MGPPEELTRSYNNKSGADSFMERPLEMDLDRDGVLDPTGRN